MMKKNNILAVIIVFTSFFILAIPAQASLIRDDYPEYFKNNTEKNEEIIKDIIMSFPNELGWLEQKKSTVSVSEYFLWDLHKMYAPIGKASTHLESLHELFMGENPQQRVLYILNKQSTTKKYDNHIAGFLLYKKSDGTNVMKKLRLGKTKWEVVDIQERKGNKF
jgi:ribosomal protein S17E